MNKPPLDTDEDNEVHGSQGDDSKQLLTLEEDKLIGSILKEDSDSEEATSDNIKGLGREGQNIQN